MGRKRKRTPRDGFIAWSVLELNTVLRDYTDLELRYGSSGSVSDVEFTKSANEPKSKMSKTSMVGYFCPECDASLNTIYLFPGPYEEKHQRTCQRYIYLSWLNNLFFKQISDLDCCQLTFTPRGLSSPIIYCLHILPIPQSYLDLLLHILARDWIRVDWSMSTESILISRLIGIHEDFREKVKNLFASPKWQQNMMQCYMFCISI